MKVQKTNIKGKNKRTQGIKRFLMTIPQKLGHNKANIIISKWCKHESHVAHKRICFFSFVFTASLFSWADTMLDKNQPYDKLSDEIVTPHIKWANPYYKGKIKALVIAPILGQRETVELAQRLSLDYTPLMTADYNEMYQESKWQPHSLPSSKVDLIIREKLRKTYDVIIIGKVSWKTLPDYLREWIKKQVHNGTGLVYICPHDRKEIEPLFDGKKTADGDRFIASGVPLGSLPALKDLDEKTILGLSLSGKGRLVKIDYGEKRFSKSHSLTPAEAHEDGSPNYDYYHGIIARAALWVTRRETDVHITKMESIDGLLNIELLNGGAKDKDIQIELIVRDSHNHIENGQERYVKLNEKQRIAFTLPPLKGGLHFLDMWVKERGETLNWSSTSVTITPNCDIEKIILDKGNHEPGDIVSGKIILGQTPRHELRLAIRLVDNFDRVMAEKTLGCLDKKVDFSFTIKEALSPLLRIEAELSDDRQLISDMKKEFPVLRRKIDDYFFAMWVGACDNHLASLALKQFYAYGVDFSYCRPSAERYHKAAKANLGIISYFSTSFFPGYGYAEMDQDTLARKPCFTDPEFRLRLKENLRRDAQLNKKYSPYYSLNINGGLSPLRCVSPLDLCFSPTCQEHFREYLKKEYQDMNALNKEWETDFKSWDEVKPMTFAQAKRHGNFAPWADHRRHMEQVFSEINLFARNTCMEIDPAAVVGLDEPNITSSYNGYNWWDLMRALDFCNPYFGKWHWRDDQRELARCLVKKQDAPTGIWFGSYWREEKFNRFVPWQSLFNGMNGVYWWVGISSTSNTGALAPDFAPLPYFSQALDEINAIKRGIGKLLLNSVREHDKIAVHYSPSSVHAATIEANEQLPPEKFPEEQIINDPVAPPDTPTQFGTSYPLYRSQQALMTVLEDIGLQYDFVANKQIESGELERGKYKALVLPYAKALSRKESEEIKTFVRNGGMVIADRVPGVMDEHCKTSKCPSLNEVFTDTKTMFKINEYGKGKAVCLHDFLDDYVFSLRMKGQEKEKRGKVKEILKSAGIEPKLSILTPSGAELGSTEVVFFKNGATEYACLLRDYLIEDTSEKEAIVIFPYQAHVYDVRSSEYHGFGKQATIKISGGQAKIFALSPYEVKGIEVSLDKEKYRQGDTVSYKIEINANSNNLAAHVFRVELVNPEGKIVKHYGKNLLAENGSCSATLSLSLNEQQGQWVMQARDTMSGKTSEKIFLVK